MNEQLTTADIIAADLGWKKDIDYPNLWNVNITYGIGGAYTYDMTVSTVNQMIPSTIIQPHFISLSLGLIVGIII
jgi:hypothetical protein